MIPSAGLNLSPQQLDILEESSLTLFEAKARLDKIDATLVHSRLRSIGKMFSVSDIKGMPHLEAKLIDAFVTVFGDPNPKLVAGMGFGTDVQRCKTQYRKFWEHQFPQEPLTDQTELFVTVWGDAKSLIPKVLN